MHYLGGKPCSTAGGDFLYHYPKGRGGRGSLLTEYGARGGWGGGGSSEQQEKHSNSEWRRRKLKKRRVLENKATHKGGDATERGKNLLLRRRNESRICRIGCAARRE